MYDLRGKCLDERGYFTFFRCHYEPTESVWSLSKLNLILFLSVDTGNYITGFNLVKFLLKNNFKHQIYKSFLLYTRR
jgi:hypothetical protein